MIHLFKHKKGKLAGKFDFAAIGNKKFLSGSGTQGYERKAGVHNALFSIAKMSRPDDQGRVLFQDDTSLFPLPALLEIRELAPGNKGRKKFTIVIAEGKLEDEYIPGK